ncbi:MAG: FtsW/RodA/SpoVE family cell cycle protein [Actinomycetota bacterium]|nr:FtsW/RodA/SpoVE family cell cycle protein [Actinomycetota bacterium]
MTATTAPPVGLAPAPASRPHTGRNVELLLLVLALAIPLAAWAYVGLTIQGEVPPDLVRYAAGLGVLFLLAHLAVRFFAPYADPLMLPVVALLNGLGLVMIHRLDLAATENARGAGRALPRADAPVQLLWTTIGVALFLVVLLLVRDHRSLQRYTYTALVAGIGLLLLPLLPGIGREINGARIWISLGGLSFQPGEIAKLVLIIFFAGYLVLKRDALAVAGRRVLGLDLPRARDLGPILVGWAVSLAILVFQRDLGTSLLFFGAFVSLLYVATERRFWMVLGVLLVGGGGYVAYQLFAHVRTRVDIWLDPFADPDNRGYQLVQSLYSFANGGLTGTGLGLGRPDLVPYAKTDFIVSAFGEELGLTGLMALLLLYGVLVERGLRAALSVRDGFGTLLATGLSIIFALQIFVVVGGVSRLIPLTGLTTPFLSYGGSSLVANYALLALLLRISDAARRPAPATSAPARVRSDSPTEVVRTDGVQA